MQVIGMQSQQAGGGVMIVIGLIERRKQRLAFGGIERFVIEGG